MWWNKKQPDTNELDFIDLPLHKEREDHVALTQEECQILWNWLKNEPIPKDHYEEINTILRKVNSVLAR